MNTLLRYSDNKNIQLFLLSLLFVLQLPAITFAQVKFSAVCANNTIGKNDYLQVQYIVENASDVEQIVPPQFKNFSVVSGPNQQSSMSIINGNVKRYIAVEFILKPYGQGSFTIPPATATVNGNTFRSNSLSVTVNNKLAGNATAGALSAPYGFNSTDAWPDDPVNRFDDYILYKGDDIGKKIKTNLFIKVDVSKTTCYVGEPIVATYKLYTRLKSESNLVKSPSFNGFSVNEIETPGNTVTTEKYHGREYSVYTLRKAQLYPLQPGKIELEPIEVENDVTFIKAEYASRKKGDIFYDMMRNFADALTPAGGTEKRTVTLQSKSLGIIVKELPQADKPKDFRGAVGAFTIDDKVQKDTITTDEAGSLSISIKGSGNLQMINAPKIYWPAEIEAFEAVSTEHIDNTAVPLKGQKIFSYSFTTAKTGKFTIAPISFSYFDIATQNYRTILTAPVTVNVKNGKDVKKAVSTEAHKFDVHPSQTAKNLIFNRNGQFLMAVILVAALIIVFVVKRAKQKDSVLTTTPENSVEQKEANEDKKDKPYILNNPLFEAQEVLLQNNPAAFYYTLNNCLKKYLSAKLSFPEIELSKKKLGELLDRHNVGLGTTLMLTSLLEHIEVNLYAPPSSANELLAAYEKAGEVVSLLDKQIS